MLQGGAQKAYHKEIDPGKQTFMEAAGIEPAQDSSRYPGGLAEAQRFLRASFSEAR